MGLPNSPICREEIPSAFDLADVQHLHAISVEGQGPVTVVTPKQRWAYAVGFPLRLDRLDSQAQSAENVLVQVDVTVRRGRVGISAVNAGGNTLMEWFCVPEDGRTTCLLRCDRLADCQNLIVRNVADTGEASKIVLYDIRVVKTNGQAGLGWLAQRQRAAIGEDRHRLPEEGGRAERGTGKFFLIAGIGHCGTKWLAHVLNHPHQGMICWHEKKAEAVPFDWLTCLAYELEIGIDATFDRYWSFLRRATTNYELVGDSHSWSTDMIPEVARRWEISRVVFLVRNGIQNVHSFHIHNKNVARAQWAYRGHLRRSWELLGQPDRARKDCSNWANWCLLWQTNLLMPEWLGEKLGQHKVSVLRLEDLLSNADILDNLIRTLNPKLNLPHSEQERFQATDVNRKVQDEDRSPQALWRKWTDDQREVFREICGPGMAKYGYPIPAAS